MKKFMTWVLLLVFGFMVGTMVLTGPVAAQEPVHWTYEGAEGPEHWGELSPDFALCSTGVEQTPIDIPSTASVNPADIEFNYQPTALNIFNNGHTIQVNYDPGSSIQVNGKVYDLKQFHFHTPSEHTINSNHTDLEMHLVHQSADGQLAVVGVMLTGGGDNPAYAPVFDNLPAQKSEPAAVSGVTLNADTLLPQERTYYRYNGSLTTPPCSEGVQWLLMNTPVQLADAQVSAFQQIFHENARPIQSINERTFLQTSTMGTTEATGTTETAETPAALPAIVFPLEGLVFGAGLLTTLTGLYMLRRKGV
jgi:carbonic anhydrase